MIKHPLLPQGRAVHWRLRRDGRPAADDRGEGVRPHGSDLWLEARQVEEARRNREFYVYVVENVRQGDPVRFTLKVLGGDRLARLLERAKEQRYYTVPWPVSDYDIEA